MYEISYIIKIQGMKNHTLNQKKGDMSYGNKN